MIALCGGSLLLFFLSAIVTGIMPYVYSNWATRASIAQDLVSFKDGLFSMKALLT